MQPIRQAFKNNFTTTAASLRGSCGIDFDHFSTSFFRFVGKHIKERRPCRVINISIKCLLVAHHLFGLKIFNKNQTEPANKFAAEFMQKVLPLIADFVMQFGKRRAGFAAAFFRMLLLQVFKFYFALLKVFGVVDQLPVTGGDKGFDSHIQADFFGADRQWLLRHIFTGKANVKPVKLTLDDGGFDFSFNRPVAFYSNCADILDVQFAGFFESAAVTISVWDRVKTLLTFKPWKTGSFTSLYSFKKSFKSDIQPTQDLLRSGKIKISNARIERPYFLKGICLIVVVNRFSPLAPTYDPVFKSAVVEITSGVKQRVKPGFLCFIGEESVFERFAHELSYNFQYLITRNILTKGGGSNSSVA